MVDVDRSDVPMAEVPSKTYTLVAKLGDKTETVEIIGQYDYLTQQLTESLSGTVDDGIEWDAAATAVREILNRAVKSRLWAFGQIELRDPNGTVILDMSEKNEAQKA